MSLAVVGARLDGAVVTVRVEGGSIAAVGPDVVPQAGDELVEAAGMAVVPGMVNAHTHAAMALFRGFGDDLPLMTWLRTRIWPAEGRLTPDDVYWGTRLACLEMVRSGTTAFADMYWHPAEVGRAVDDAGLRALVAPALVDGGEVAGAGELRQVALASLDELAACSPRVTPMLGPHAVYTVSEPSLAWLGELAAERDLGVHVHLSETEEEVEGCVAATGLRPPELLDRHGLLGPGTLAAHGCWLEAHELELLAERGATLVANPVSNMKLAVGRLLDHRRATVAGVPLGLGTDGAASNNGLDLFQDVKLLALTAKFQAGDAAVLPAAEALAIARGERSTLLGGQGVRVGAPADLLLLRTGEPEVIPGDQDANLAYAATGALVDTTIVDGRVLMRHREVPGSDEVLGQVRDRVRRLTGA